jgi:uncharacterized protein involved in high-affinity Fe2+ transport
MVKKQRTAAHLKINNHIVRKENMFKKIMLTTAVITSVISLPSFAATEISWDETSKYVHVGDISVGGKYFSPDDAKSNINMKAAEAGADYYYVSRFTRGNTGFGANAVLYKER